MMLTSEYMAFPQRVLLGIEAMVGADGTPLTASQAQIAVSRSRLLRLPPGEQGAPEPKIDQWDAVDLKNYVEARNHILDGMFSKGRLPINYNARGQLANISADALRAAEKNLYSRCEMKLPGFDTGHEDDDAARAPGDGERSRRGGDRGGHLAQPGGPHGGRARRRGREEAGDGDPDEIVYEDLGYTPQKIDRIKTLQARGRRVQPRRPPPPRRAPGPPQGAAVADARARRFARITDTYRIHVGRSAAGRPARARAVGDARPADLDGSHAAVGRKVALTPCRSSSAPARGCRSPT
jgi:hypothetical protein